MKLRNAVRAVVFRGGEMLIMDRIKFGKKYRALVGGGVEPGETLEAAVLREVSEETTLEVTNPRLLFREISPDFEVVQNVFLCQYKNGEPALDPKSEEYADSQGGQNLYHPRWISLDQLDREAKEYPFITPRLLSEIKSARNSGFSDGLKEWTN